MRANKAYLSEVFTAGPPYIYIFFSRRQSKLVSVGQATISSSELGREAGEGGGCRCSVIDTFTLALVSADNKYLRTQIGSRNQENSIIVGFDLLM